jgi:hypothetical protein
MARDERGTRHHVVSDVTAGNRHVSNEATLIALIMVTRQRWGSDLAPRNRCNLHTSSVPRPRRELSIRGVQRRTGHRTSSHRVSVVNDPKSLVPEPQGYASLLG